MRFGVRAAMLVLGLASAGMVQAQQATGSLRGEGRPVSTRREGTFTGDEAREFMDRYAICVVRQHPSEVTKGLALPRDSAEQWNALHRLFTAECLQGTGAARQIYSSDVWVQSSPVAFRAALFKAMVARDYARHPAEFAPTPVVFSPDTDISLRFAACVVLRDPEGGRALVLTTAGTPAETEAVQHLVPQLGQCLEANNTLAFVKADFVGRLAEAYYREAAAGRAARSN